MKNLVKINQARREIRLLLAEVQNIQIDLDANCNTYTQGKYESLRNAQISALAEIRKLNDGLGSMALYPTMTRIKR